MKKIIIITMNMYYYDNNVYIYTLIHIATPSILPRNTNSSSNTNIGSLLGSVAWVILGH